MARPRKHKKRVSESFEAIIPPYYDQVACGPAVGRNILMVGPAGTGKTTTVQALSQVHGKKLYVVQGHLGLTIEELRGTFALRNGNSEFIDGPVVRAFRDGGWVLVDEANACQPGVTIWLNNAAEEGVMYIPETGETLTRPAGVLFFLCYNEGYNGTRPINQALKDRFRVVKTDYWPEELELKLLRKKLPRMVEKDLRTMVNVANAVRAASREGTIDWDFSVRSLLQWGEDADYRTQCLMISFEDVILPKVGCNEVEYAAEHEILRQIARLEMG